VSRQAFPPAIPVLATPLICHCKERSNLSFPVFVSAAQFFCHCEPAKQSLFSCLCKRSPNFVIASLRSNLSFFCLPALKRRDRFVPRDDIFHLSLRAQRGNLSFICLPALDRRDRFVPRDDIFHLSLRARRGNLSFICLPALERRDCVVHLFCHCERSVAISPLSVCWPLTIEIASYLAMTKRRAERGNLSLVCLPALKRRDRFVPRDDR